MIIKNAIQVIVLLPDVSLLKKLAAIIFLFQSKFVVAIFKVKLTFHCYLSQ